MFIGILLRSDNRGHFAHKMPIINVTRRKSVNAQCRRRWSRGTVHCNDGFARSLLTATTVEIVPIFKTNDCRNLKTMAHFSSRRRAKTELDIVGTGIVCFMECWGASTTWSFYKQNVARQQGRSQTFTVQGNV